MINVVLKSIHLPGSMLVWMTRTHESLSGRFCSWKKPTACISSWIAVPFLRQSEARETFCSPPCLPILEKQLQNTKKQLNYVKHIQGKYLQVLHHNFQKVSQKLVHYINITLWMSFTKWLLWDFLVKLWYFGGLSRSSHWWILPVELSESHIIFLRRSRDEPDTGLVMEVCNGIQYMLPIPRFCNIHTCWT